MCHHIVKTVMSASTLRTDDSRASALILNDLREGIQINLANKTRRSDRLT